MEEDNKLRVHGHQSTGRLRDARFQIETGYSSLPLNPILKDSDRNPVTRLSDDMKVNATKKQQSNPATLYSSYHPGMHAASATFAGEPCPSSQSVGRDMFVNYGGARPKMQQSNTVIGASSLQAGDTTWKNMAEISKPKSSDAYRPDKYETPTQPENQTFACIGIQESCEKKGQIHLKVLTPCDIEVTHVKVIQDIDTYMKWRFILKSPTRLNAINQRLGTKCNLTNECVLKFKDKYTELEKKSEQVISTVVDGFGKDLKVEQVYVSDGEAQGVASKLASLAISVIHILYVEAFTDEAIYLVYEKSKETSVKEQIEEIYERFSVRIALPMFWKKLSEKIKLKEKLQHKSHAVRVSFAEWRDIDSYVCDIFGRFFLVTETAHKLNYFKQSLRSKTLPMSANMTQTVKNLKLCDILQERIDKEINGVCLLVDWQSGLQMLYFKNEPIDTWISLVQSWLSEVVIDMSLEQRNRSSIEKLHQTLDAECDGKIQMIPEHNGCVIVGLKENVDNVKEILTSFRYESLMDNEVKKFSRKCGVKGEDFLDTQIMLANDIAKKNCVNVDCDRNERGSSFRFIGSQEGVEQSCKEFKASNNDMKKEEVCLDKALAKSKQTLEFLSKLQTEHEVKVLMDKISAVDGNDEGKKSRAIIDKIKDKCTWTFPTGRRLIIDVDSTGVWTEPEIIIELAEKKPSLTDQVLSAFTEFRSGQKRAIMHMPKWNVGGREQTTRVKKKLRQILDKVKEQHLRSVGIYLDTVGDWPFITMAETLLPPIFKHVEHFESGEHPKAIIFCCRSIDMSKKIEMLVHFKIDPDYDGREIQIDVTSGELNLFEADILVNTTSPTLDLNYGSVSSAILKTAGQELQLECKQKYPEGVHGRNVAVTQGYGLKCQYVIHGALHKFNIRNQTTSLQELRDFIQSCLHKAVQLKVMSIAFPVIGSGNLGFPADLVASEMFTAVEKLKQTEQECSLRFVYFVVYHKDKATLEVFQRVHADMVKHSPKHCKVSSENSDMNTKLSGLMMVKVIGKTSSVDEAVKAIKDRYKQPVLGSDKQELADSEICQVIDNVLPHEFSIILRLFPAEVEKMNDYGVKAQFENNMIKFKGKIDKILESVKEVKVMLQDLRRMYHIRVSIREKEKRQIKRTLKQISAQYPEVYHYFDEIMAIIYMYGRKPDHVKDVEEAGRLFRYGKDERQETAEDKISKPAMFKPTVQRNFSWTSSAKNLRAYQAGNLEVKVYEGDLLEAPVDCIVNAANKDLNHAGGIAHSIATRAGEELKKECYHIIQQASLSVGSVVETTAGHLPYNYILHTVGPCWFDYQPITKHSLKKCEEDLFMAISNTFRKAEELKIESIALPAISSAIFRVPVEICALQYGRAVLNFAKSTTYLKKIHFVDKDQKTIGIIQNVFKCLISEDRPFAVNRLVYLDVTERKNNKSARRNSQNPRNEIDNEISLSTGGMVLYEPFCRMEGSKMICVFTTCQEIHIYTGDILNQKGIDAIVCSEDRSFSAAGIVARELLKHGGEEYKKAKTEAYRQHPTMDEGDIIVSTGGKNNFFSVIHALIPNSKPIEYLKDLLENILEQCVREGYKSVVMSLLGSGQGKQHPELCSRQLLMAYNNFCIRNPGYKFTLYIVNIKRDITSAIQTTFTEHINSRSLAVQSQHTSGDRNSKGKAESTLGKLSLTEDYLSDMVKIPPSQSATGSFSRSLKSSLKNTESTDVKQLYKTVKDDEITAHYMEDSNSRQKSCKENTEQDKDGGEDLTATCVICMDKLENPKTLKCGHLFCTDCIDQYFKVKPVCPTCFTVCGVITGNQPDGVMEIMKLKTNVTGYENCGSLGVTYRFESGHQGDQHPDPGAWFHGINRIAYLPNTKEGCKICAMLRVAFERRLVFTIGTSRTTGQEGVITWNDIHHKTDHRPYTQFGYPDATYLTRVKEELAVKGVMEEDIDKDFLKLLNEPTFDRRNIPVYSEPK